MFQPPYVRRRLPDPTSPAGQRVKAERANEHFFSRYQPHLRHLVTLFGVEAGLREAVRQAGLHTGRDIQIGRYHTEDSSYAVALFRHKSDALKMRRIIVPTDEALQCVDRLKHDAHLEATMVALPKRPVIPELRADASPSAVIDAVLERSDGMVVGESHHAVASKRFLIDHIATLQKHGVQTLFMEHLLSDEHQADLDAWHDSPRGSEMPGALRTYLARLDRGHMAEQCVDQESRPRYRLLRQRYCFTAVAQAAQRAGIKIVAADCRASYEVHTGGLGGTSESAHTRAEVMNYFASEKIRRRSLPGKWVALVGNAHANTFHGVPGVAEQTGTLAVVVNDKIKTPDAPAVKTRVSDFHAELHLDIVVAMGWD